VSLRLDEQLLKIDAHRTEYVLFQLMNALLREHLCTPSGWGDGMRSRDLLVLAERLPADALRPDRRRREYLNGVLARNELGASYPYNRRLFLRVGHGRYVLNPGLALRRGEGWVPVYEAMGLRAMASLGLRRYVDALELIEIAQAYALAPRDGAEEARSDFGAA
jgi:hypothetical protein